MKPDIKFNGVQLDIWNAVAAAKQVNMSVERFAEVAREAWAAIVEYESMVADAKWAELAEGSK